IHMKFGRNFSAESGSANYQVIVNESTVKKIGWPLDESVIGRQLKYPNSDDANFEVIGVVSDFNYWSLQTPIEPLAIFHIANDKVFAGDRQYLALRVRAEDNATWQSMLAQLNGVW